MNKEERIDWIFVSGLGTSQLAAVSVTFRLIQVIIVIGLTFGNGADSYILTEILVLKNNKELPLW